MPNISIRPFGQKAFGERIEIKNINSFKFVHQALHYEKERQIEILESGGEVQRQTRQYDADSNITLPMRDKEEENDYRYFKEPDLPVIEVNESLIFQEKK